MSSVVDYNRLKRIDISDPPQKYNLNHLCMVIGALLIMYIFKRAKDKKSDRQL